MGSGDENTYYDLAISMRPIGNHTRVADVSSVVTIENSNAKTLKLWIQVEDQPVRYRVDGSDPTSTVGFLLAASEWIVLTVPSDNSVKLLETTSAAVLQYQWLD